MLELSVYGTKNLLLETASNNAESPRDIVVKILNKRYFFHMFVLCAGSLEHSLVDTATSNKITYAV